MVVISWGTSWWAPEDPSQHRTAQQRQWGAETGRSQEIADDIVCVLLCSPHSTLGLVLVDGGGIYTRGLVLI